MSDEIHTQHNLAGIPALIVYSKAFRTRRLFTLLVSLIFLVAFSIASLTFLGSQIDNIFEEIPTCTLGSEGTM